MLGIILASFMVGLTTGFLICVFMSIDMFERNGLYVKDGKIVDLPCEEKSE